MNNIKCYHEQCRKICIGEDWIYQVCVINGNGQEWYVPCCSEECADIVKRHYMAIHYGRYRSVEHQGFQKMSVNDYQSD